MARETPTPALEKIGAPGECPTFRHEAMATVFEISVRTTEATYAAQAATAAFQVLDRLEQLLSRYVENSDVSRVNRWAARRPVPVNPSTFGLLQRCQELRELTEGAFDITASALRVREGQRGTLTPGQGILLNAQSRTVELADGEVQVDLGGVGKGFALDRMAEVFAEWDLREVLLNGGSSSILALDNPRGRPGWPVRIAAQDQPLLLCRQALGASGIARGPHIVDPRKRQLVDQQRAAWCLARDATTADALATAFMVLEERAIERVCRREAGSGAVVYGPARVKGGTGRLLGSFGWPG